MARDVEEVVAVGVNCLDPAEVGVLVRQAAAASGGKPVVAYPNQRRDLGPGTPPLDRAGTIRPGLVQDWVEAGARLVGGCCRVTPDDIRALSENLRTL